MAKKRKKKPRSNKNKRWPKNGIETYALRDKRLASLGFSSYREYLNSPLWVSIRTRVYTVKGNVCHGCGAKATSVHHMSYRRDVLRGRNIVPLYPVCDRCHTAIEYTTHGQKRTFVDACKAGQRVLRLRGYV